MRILLDTHTFIWFAFNAKELPIATRELLEDAASELYFSYVSVWEMVIKVSIGKLSFSQKVVNLVSAQVQKDGVHLLPIELSHIALVEAMPLHHKDPFDRLLIAQARAENLILVSVDAAFDLYGINRLWLT